MNTVQKGIQFAVLAVAIVVVMVAFAPKAFAQDYTYYPSYDSTYYPSYDSTYYPSYDSTYYPSYDNSYSEAPIYYGSDGVMYSNYSYPTNYYPTVSSYPVSVGYPVGGTPSYNPPPTHNQPSNPGVMFSIVPIGKPTSVTNTQPDTVTSNNTNVNVNNVNVNVTVSVPQQAVVTPVYSTPIIQNQIPYAYLQQTYQAPYLQQQYLPQTQVLQQNQQSVAEIEAALFALRDTSAVSFGNMYSYAKEASLKTGVRPAFILAILSQESDLGKNIGSCLVTDLQTGDGVGKSGEIYQQVMKVSRDTDPFLSITQQFAIPWAATPVSCPLGRMYTESRGYGGAMGPAQFIPSTWQLYANRIASSTAQSRSNPWDPRTATFAVAIYMSDLGADQWTATAEKNAALKYFAGSHWQNPSYSFYGTHVMCLADKFQHDIDVLNNVVNPQPTCQPTYVPPHVSLTQVPYTP